MILKLAHICFVVRDLDVATKFYADKLGFKRAFDFINDRGELFGRYFHIGDGSFLELFLSDHEDRSDSGSYRHFCLQVDNIQSEYERLKAAGVELSEIRLGSDNSYQSWLEDPDGNRIELHQYTEQSKQYPFV